MEGVQFSDWVLKKLFDRGSLGAGMAEPHPQWPS